MAAAGSGRVEVIGVDADDDAPTKVVVAPLNSIPGESPEQRQARLGHTCDLIHYHGWLGTRLQPAMRKACLQYAADNGRSIRETFYHQLPRAMFVFLPLLAAVMLLQFAGQTYVALYVYWSMRRVYGQGRLLTVSKYVVMSWAYVLSAGIMVVLTGVYSTLLL